MTDHSNWANASRLPTELVQTIELVRAIVIEHYRLYGAWPTVDQILERLARP